MFRGKRWEVGKGFVSPQPSKPSDKGTQPQPTKSKKIVHNIYDASGRLVAQKVTTRATGESYYLDVATGKKTKTDPTKTKITKEPTPAEPITEPAITPTPAVIKKPTPTERFYASPFGRFLAGVGRRGKEMLFRETPFEAAVAYPVEKAYKERKVPLKEYKEPKPIHQTYAPPLMVPPQLKSEFELLEKQAPIITKQKALEREYEAEIERVAKEKGYTIIKKPSPEQKVTIPETFKKIQTKYEKRFEKEIIPEYESSFEEFKKEKEITFKESFGYGAVSTAPYIISGAWILTGARAIGRYALFPSQAKKEITEFGMALKTPAGRGALAGGLAAGILLPSPVKIPLKISKVSKIMSIEPRPKVSAASFGRVFKSKAFIGMEVKYPFGLTKTKLRTAEIITQVGKARKGTIRRFTSEAIVREMKTAKPIEKISYEGIIEKTPKTITTKEGIIQYPKIKVTTMTGVMKAKTWKPPITTTIPKTITPLPFGKPKFSPMKGTTAFFKTEFERFVPSIRKEGIKYFRGKSRLIMGRRIQAEFPTITFELKPTKPKPTDFLIKKPIKVKGRKYKPIYPPEEKVKTPVEPIKKPTIITRQKVPKAAKEIIAGTSELIKARQIQALKKSFKLKLPLKTKKAVRLKTLQEQKMKIRGLQKMKTILMPKEKLIPKAKTGLRFTQIQPTRLRQAISPRLRLKMTQISTPKLPPFLPKSGFRPGLPFMFPSVSLGEIKTKSQLRKQQKAYTPSLRAIEFNIFGKKPERITGLELRKIPLGYRKKKNKKK